MEAGYGNEHPRAWGVIQAVNNQPAQMLPSMMVNDCADAPRGVSQ